MKEKWSYLLLFIFGFVIYPNVSAQDLNEYQQPVSPVGGATKLLLHFHRIDFNEEQRVILSGKKIQLIFLVSDKGKATLEEVKGVYALSILDSLYESASSIPRFNPQVVNGKPVESLYFLEFSLPDLKMVSPFMFYPLRRHVDEFESLHTSNMRLDVLFDVLMSKFTGNLNDYLGLGGGFRTGLYLTGENKGIIGLHMNMYGNPSKQDYLIPSSREQNAAPPTMFMG